MPLYSSWTSIYFFKKLVHLNLVGTFETIDYVSQIFRH
jgi:hypothetical protein